MTGEIVPRGQAVPTGHDWKTAEGQQALARLLMYGAQAGTAAANIAEVMRRHRPISRANPFCTVCAEAWYSTTPDGAESRGCSAWLLADAIEGVLWVASHKPGDES